MIISYEFIDGMTNAINDLLECLIDVFKDFCDNDLIEIKKISDNE